MRYYTIILFLVLSLVANAQHNCESHLLGYFPENYFMDWRCPVDKCNSMAQMMHLCGIEKLYGQPIDDDVEVFRLSTVAQYSHPVFVSIERRSTEVTLYWKVGNTRRMDYDSLYDRNLHPGVKDSGMLNLTMAEWDGLWRLINKNELLKKEPGDNTNCWKCMHYIFEYRCGKISWAHSTSIPGKKLQSLADYLLQMVGEQYVDIQLYDEEHIQHNIPKDSIMARVQRGLNYPPSALADLRQAVVEVETVVDYDSVFILQDSYSQYKEKYPFSDSAIVAVDRVIPYIREYVEGTPNRFVLRIPVRFVLPDSIRPVFHHNLVCRNHADSIFLERYESFQRQLLVSPNDFESYSRLGNLFYFEHKYSLRMLNPNPQDEIFVDLCPPNQHCSNQFVVNPADSALHYFYLAWENAKELEEYLRLYEDILYLEQVVGCQHNPEVEVSQWDTTEGLYYPISAFSSYNRETIFSEPPEYEGGISSSLFWATVFSEQLRFWQEPVLYSQRVGSNDTLQRFAFYPSFDLPYVIRIEKIDNKLMLYWCGIDTTGLSKSDGQCYPTKGHKELTRKQYNRIQKMVKNSKMDVRGRLSMTGLDGAEWVYEVRTTDGFFAQNIWSMSAGKEVLDLFEYLQKLAGIKAKYMRGYGFE